MKFTKSLLKTSAAVALVASAQAAMAGGHGEIKWAHMTKKWVSK
jgi:hypothetical protein